MGRVTGAVPVVLCFVRAGERVLLIRVDEGKPVFKGRWNGLGGKAEPGENLREAARREVLEEAGLEVEPELRAVISETGLGGRDCLLLVFTAEIPAARAGAPLPPTREGQLAWHEPDRLPWDDCAPDLREILPRVLATDRVLFGSERYEGGDRLTWLELD